MSWLDNQVFPKIRKLIEKKSIPENLWELCNECQNMIFKRDLVKNLGVCPQCDHHKNIPYQTRLAILCDEYVELSYPIPIDDPLKFKDKKRYIDRLMEYRKSLSMKDAYVCFKVKINQQKAVLGIMDFRFMGGSMGRAVGAGIQYSAMYAIEHKLPLILFTSSGGARMQEGIMSLMQMPKTIASLCLLRQNKLPCIIVLTNPTTGGVSASFASLGDMTLAEPGAIIGFTGARVIANTIGTKLPPNFQKAEYLMEKGIIDIIVHRKDQKQIIEQILQHLSPAA